MKLFALRHNEPTIKQERAVDALTKRGWRVDHRDDDTVYLSKRKKPGQTLYAQIDPDGVVSA